MGPLSATQKVVLEQFGDKHPSVGLICSLAEKASQAFAPNPAMGSVKEFHPDPSSTPFAEPIPVLFDHPDLFHLQAFFIGLISGSAIDTYTLCWTFIYLNRLHGSFPPLADGRRYSVHRYLLAALTIAAKLTIQQKRVPEGSEKWWPMLGHTYWYCHAIKVLGYEHDSLTERENKDAEEVVLKLLKGNYVVTPEEIYWNFRHELEPIVAGIP